MEHHFNTKVAEKYGVDSCPPEKMRTPIQSQLHARDITETLLNVVILLSNFRGTLRVLIGS
jgi:hypothetical protein